MCHNLCAINYNITFSGMNPFFIQQYGGPKYFCDRKADVERLINATNNRSVVLHAMRRLGKTGLIQHLQHLLAKKHKYSCIYLDILDTETDAAFVSQFISACIQQLYTDQRNILTKVTNYFGRYKPKFSIDTLTGNPSISLEITTPQEIDLSLEATFSLLREHKKPIHIAIDEFQQIGEYNHTRIDATLRKHLSQSDNITMLFSGSQRHLLLHLFNDPKKPMYRSVEQMELNEIPYPKYSSFIKRMFKKGAKTIDDRVIHLILKWTRSHTFYTQYLCNRLYALDQETIKETDLLKMQHQLLNEQQMTFLSYRNILSKNQYEILKAIAKESSVKSVRTKDFITTYGIAASTAQQSLDYLVNKEMVYEKLSEDGSEYFVYDLFLSRWLEGLQS